ncbi:MAG: hypothetical protein GY810_02680 [Aureispira sp.]|nr:hypothetical protein [Aureispira sp.]
MREIDNNEEFEQWLGSAPEVLPKVAIQSLNLTAYHEQLCNISTPGSLFLGCTLTERAAGHIVTTGGVVIPQLEEFLFCVHRARLYKPMELFKGFDPSHQEGYYETVDYQIYKQYLAQGRANPPSIQTTLARRLHDHSITEALDDAIANKKVVAIMGGHSMERRDPFYSQIARLSRTLTQKGFLMVSGGGPGAMEATHLGAFFAARPLKDLEAAIAELSVRPPNAPKGREYADWDWLHRAWEVAQKFPIPKGKEEECMSIGIPTWLYGHEPPALFATHIAKYFANSVREDGLLMIAKHGVIFAPGSAGTTQEIFQDATQNHYAKSSKLHVSPMILFGKKHWTEVRPVWPLLQKVTENEVYGELLALTDNTEEIVRRILNYNPDVYKLWED